MHDGRRNMPAPGWDITGHDVQRVEAQEQNTAGLNASAHRLRS